MTHDLKSWPEYFKATVDGSKTFELRKNDRDFKVGDTVVLWEYIPETETLTGQTLVTKITYLLTSGPWLQEGYCCFGFESELGQQDQARVRAEALEEAAESMCFDCLRKIPIMVHPHDDTIYRHIFKKDNKTRECAASAIRQLMAAGRESEANSNGS